MFKRSTLDTYANATPSSRISPNTRVPDPPPIKLRKKPKEKFTFALINGIVAPPGAVAAIQIAGEGIRNLLDVTTTKLYRIPLPLMERMELYEGFSDMDLAHVVSGVLIIATSLIWIRVIKEAKGFGTVMEYRSNFAALFWFYAGVAAAVILLDGFIFFLGVRARGGGWGEMAWYVAPVCTVFYMVLVAAFGIFHADYATGKRV